MTDAARSLPNLPRYRSHKIVEAARITDIRGPILFLDIRQEGNGLYFPIEVSQHWFEKHNPQVGGYYVVYEDDYRSYSPAPAFESGYTPMQPTGVHLNLPDSVQGGPVMADEQAAAPVDIRRKEVTLEQDLARVLNKHSAENGSNTPDFILAQFLLFCLTGWNAATVRREEWYGWRLRVASDSPVKVERCAYCGDALPEHGEDIHKCSDGGAAMRKRMQEAERNAQVARSIRPRRLVEPLDVLQALNIAGGSQLEPYAIQEVATFLNNRIA